MRAFAFIAMVIIASDGKAAQDMPGPTLPWGQGVQQNLEAQATADRACRKYGTAYKAQADKVDTSNPHNFKVTYKCTIAKEPPATTTAPAGAASDPNHPYATKADWDAAAADVPFSNAWVELSNKRTAAVCAALTKSRSVAGDAEAMRTYYRRLHADIATIRTRFNRHLAYLKDFDWRATQQEAADTPTGLRGRCQSAQ